MAFINIKYTAFISKTLGKRLKQFFINDPNIGNAVNRAEFLLALDSMPGYWGRESFPLNKYYYKTDDRLFGEDGTHRLQLAATIDVSKIGTPEFFGAGIEHFDPDTDQSERYVIEYDTNLNRFLYGEYEDSPETALPTYNESVYPTFKNLLSTNSPNNPESVKSVNIEGTVKASYPFVEVLGANLSPDIDMNLKLTLFKDSSKVRCFIKGKHDLFPCYELICNNKLIYQYDPAKNKQFAPNAYNLNWYTSFTKIVDFLI